MPIYLLVLLLVIRALADQELHLDRTTELQSLGDGGYAFYNFSVPSRLRPGSAYLIFDVVGTSENADPDIYISISAPRPTVANNTWRCSAFGQDLCVVPRESVVPGAAIYSTVFCQRKCEYKVTLRAEEEQTLQAGLETEGELKEYESRIFSFFIPATADVYSVSVLLTLGANTMSKVRMFVLPAKEPGAVPSSQTPVRSLPTWQGLAARVYKSEDRIFCKDCMYRVLVTSAVATSYGIIYHVSKQVTPIHESTVSLFESVRFDENNCYSYMIQDAESTFEAGLTVFSGNPDIFVHPHSMPAKLENFAFSSRGNFDEVLSITPEQRRALGSPTGPYFVCIHGNYTSVYNLMVRSLTGALHPHIPTASGMTRTTSVRKGELKVFEYVVDAVSRRYRNKTSFSLYSINGNADLYVKYCRSPANESSSSVPACTLAKADLNANGVLRSLRTSSIDHITTTFNPAACAAGEKCSYVIGVYGVQDSNFSLSVLGEEEVELLIAEGVPVFGHVGLHQFRNYVFAVEDPAVRFVGIQLDSVNGDSDLYVSRVNPFCGCLLAERGSRLENFLTDTISFNRSKDGNLNATYHISVFGFTESNYMLHFSVIGSSGVSKGIRLYDGQPLTGVINGSTEGTDSLLYHFATTFPPRAERDIRITLTPVTGYYMVYVGVNTIPTEKSYNWSFDGSEPQLQILASEKNYRSNATYNVLVMKASRESPEPHTFSLKFTTGAFLATLVEGQPEIGNITLMQPANYRYNVVNLTGIVTVTVTPFSGDPDLYISANSSNKAPSAWNADYISAKVGADSIKVPLVDLQKKNSQCRPNAIDMDQCALYISIICAAQEGCAYSLVVTQTYVPISNLLEGIPQFGTVTPWDPQIYTFSPSASNSSLIISVYPKKGKIQAYARVSHPQRSRGAVKPSYIPIDYNISSMGRAGAEVISIPRSMLEQCGYFCQIYIGVYYLTDTGSREDDTSSEFTIVASSKVVQLSDGQSVTDFVGEKAYKYYTFLVTCNDCTISVSLTALSAGDPDLYVNKGQTRLPNVENADFRLSGYRSDFLQISPDHLFFSDQHVPFSGPYSIAVYGFQNCTYSLTVTTSASRIQEMSVGVPARMQQERGKVTYYMFHSWKRQSFLIALTLRSGRTSIRANAVKTLRETNVLEKLPVTEMRSTWSSIQSNSVNALRVNRADRGFVDDGYYLVAVETQEDSDYDITILYTSETDYTYLRVSEPFRYRMERNEVKRLAFVVASQAKIGVRINLFYGRLHGKVATEPTEAETWAVDSGLALTIYPTDPHFVVGTYFVTLNATEDSEFTITISSGEDLVRLGEGLPQTSEVSLNKPLAYFVYSIPMIKMSPDNERRLSVFARFEDPTARPVIYIRHISKNDPTMPSPLRYDVMLEWDNVLKQIGGTFPLSSVFNSSIAIAVTQREYRADASYKFDVVAWSSGIVLIEPEHQYSRQMNEAGETSVYELSVQNTSRLYVEVVPCVGEVEFYITRNLASIGDRKYDIKKFELNKGRLFGSIEAEVGVYYITVRGLALGEGQTGRTSIHYSIRTMLSDAKDVAELEDMYLGNYGTIEYTLESSELALSWGKLYKKTPLGAEVPDITYTVFASEDGTANLYTVCGIRYGKTKQLGDTTEQTFRYPLHSFKRDRKLGFAVVATTPAVGRGNSHYSLAYSPLFLQIPKAQRSSRVMVVLLWALVLALAGATVYYCRRVKAIQKRLEYEMSDARNLAQVSTFVDVSQAKTDKYSHLKTQTEEN